MHMDVTFTRYRTGKDLIVRTIVELSPDKGECKTFRKEMPWAELGGFCDRIGVDKYKVADQAEGSAEPYSARPGLREQDLASLGFEDVSHLYGPVRLQVVPADQINQYAQESRREGYDLQSASAPNGSNEVTLIFRRG